MESGRKGTSTKYLTINNLDISSSKDVSKKMWVMTSSAESRTFQRLSAGSRYDRYAEIPLTGSARLPSLTPDLWVMPIRLVRG